MTKDILDIKRFGRYFASDFRSGISHYWLSGLIVAAMPILAELLAGIFSLILTGSWTSNHLAPRLFLGSVMMAVAVITIPAKLYGHVTGSKSGPSFIQLPVSTFEKTSSMILNAGVVFPAMIAILYLVVDALVCLADPGCGKALIACTADGLRFIQENIVGDFPAELSGLEAAVNPALYIDDIIESSLIFLLGAVCFRKNKIAKTIAVLIGIAIATSAISSPIMIHYAGSLADADDLSLLLDKFGWCFNHIGLLDTLNDTLVNLALSVAIFFRVKTIKF